MANLRGEAGEGGQGAGSVDDWGYRSFGEAWALCRSAVGVVGAEVGNEVDQEVARVAGGGRDWANVQYRERESQQHHTEKKRARDKTRGRNGS